MGLVIMSCKDSKPVNAPANLLPAKKMSELIADFAINDQMSYMNSGGNLETSSRFILKKHRVTARQFSESYKYYLASPTQLQNILDDAQEMVKDKDPEAEKYIDKKLKEVGKTVPQLAR